MVDCPTAVVLPFGERSKWLHGRISTPSGVLSLLAVQTEEQCPCLAGTDGSYIEFDGVLIDTASVPQKEAVLGVVALEGGALAKLSSVGGDATFDFTPRRALSGPSSEAHMKLFFPEVADHLRRRGSADLPAVVIEGVAKVDIAALIWVDGRASHESSSSSSSEGKRLGSSKPPSEVLLARRWNHEDNGGNLSGSSSSAVASVAPAGKAALDHIPSCCSASAVASGDPLTAAAEAATGGACSGGAGASTAPLPDSAGGKSSAAAAHSVAPDADGWYTVIRERSR